MRFGSRCYTNYETNDRSPVQKFFNYRMTDNLTIDQYVSKSEEMTRKLKDLGHNLGFNTLDQQTMANLLPRLLIKKALEALMAAISLEDKTSIRDKGETLSLSDFVAFERSQRLLNQVFPAFSPFPFDSEDNCDTRDTMEESDAAHAQECMVGIMMYTTDDCVPSCMEVQTDSASRKRFLGEPKGLSLEHNIDNAATSVPNNKEKTSKSPNALSRTYNNTDLLPYVVHVHNSKLDNGKNSSPVNLYPTVVGSILIGIVDNDILETKKSGKGKISVEFRSDSAANNLVQNNVLAKHNLKAFISLHRIMRTGIIKDVPQEIDVDTVKEILSSPCKVLEIKEVHPEEEDYSLKSLVRQSPRCINCLGGYLATSHECPIIQEYKVVLSLAASENLFLMDAKRKIRYSNDTNRASLTYSRLDFDNFSLLKKNSKGTATGRRQGGTHPNPVNRAYGDTRLFQKDSGDIFHACGSQGGRFSAMPPAFSSASYADITRVLTANIERGTSKSVSS
ncbi:hypothetical protein G5I_13900 [Acromyrmex echinatior]|uniref:Uncharacterized protein n=1 Tax=Acromyrmex echinatior TaxID=103372 RepID=F4X696_ACREC|nr:hypothetical protein G5I_13900 [Acromyrmex echinatior]